MGARLVGTWLIGTTFLRGSVFTTSNFRASGVTFASAATSAGVIPAVTAFTSGMLAGLLELVCSLLSVLAFVRFALLPEIDLDLAMGYSLHMPRFRNESSCPANHIHLASQRLRED